MKKVSVLCFLAALLMSLGTSLGGGSVEHSDHRTKSPPRASPLHQRSDLLDWIERSYGHGSAEIILPLKEGGKLWIPAVGMKESLTQAMNESPGRSLNVRDLSLGVHMAQVTLPDGSVVPQAAAYTSTKLLSTDEFIEASDALPWLKRTLYISESDGIVLNPKTRFVRADHQGVYLSANRFGTAEIIGFLEAPMELHSAPFSQLANQAYQRGHYFQVLYYWARAYRTASGSDDWKKAEASKLLSYYHLDFPGSRARAASELAWMQENHPSSDLNEVVRTLHQDH